MSIFRIPVAALILALVPILAQAQKFPDRPVKIVVPYTPGGGTDTVARALSQRLSEMWGQPVVVENRPGAGGTLGADAVAKAPRDGHTLLFSDVSLFVINPHIFAKLPFDPLKDLAAIARVVQLAPVLAVANNSPGKTVAELIDYAKANPGKLTYASPGVGTYTHVAMEYLKHMTGADMLHVPYRGSAPAMTDLLGGRVTMYMVTYSVFDEAEKAGKLKIVATANHARLPMRPDLPTIGETVKDFGINVWFGLAGPAGTPEPVLDKIHSDVAAILREPQFNDTFIKPQAYIAGSGSRAEFAAQIVAEHAQWEKLVKVAGVQAQ